MERIKVLDVLRGLAAIFVMFFHYSKFWDEKSNLHLMFKYGYTGVLLFFMISGFVIFISINKSSNSLEFLYKRFARLYPTFWICLFLTSLIVKNIGLEGREVGWQDTLVNITMIPKIFGFKNVDGVYWTLCYEFFFYLLMAFLLKIQIIKNVLIWVIPWLFLCIVHNFIFQLPKTIAFSLNLSYGIFFISGILFSELKKNDNKIVIHFLILCCLFFAIYGRNDLYEGCFVLFYYILFYLICFEKINWCSNKLFVFLGTISYPLYLLHQNIGYIIISKLKLYLNNFNFFIVPSICSILLSFLVYKYFELPIMNKMRLKFFSKKMVK